MPAYLLPIQETISIAWSKVKGSKSSFWAALGIIILLSLIIDILLGIYGLGSLDKKDTTVLGYIIEFVLDMFLYLLNNGVQFIGIQRALDQPISYRLMFKPFEWQTALRLIGVFFLYFLLFYIAIILLFILVVTGSFAHSALSIVFMILGAGIIAFILCYIFIRISLVLAFILDKKTGIYQSLKLSVMATRNNFWRLIFIWFIAFLFIIIATIPLGIGLIWVFPLIFILYGMVYKNLLVNTTIN